jgi:hypothetical protein
MTVGRTDAKLATATSVRASELAGISHSFLTD